MTIVALFGQTTNSSLIDIIDPFIDYLKEKKIFFYIEKNFLKTIAIFSRHNLEDVEVFSIGNPLNENTKFLFTFGGDGTILSAIPIIKDSRIPIIGVNTGRLGFLASINKAVFLEQLDSFFSDDYNVIPRSIIKITRTDGLAIPENYAINEITVVRRETTSMITIETYINGENLNTFWSDGLIISTPTGSTGYSLSCGGPIVHPANENFIITPVAPHNLNVRPLIVSEDVVIDLRIKSRANEYFLSLDSRNHALPTEVGLRVEKADFKVNIVESKNANYFYTLREKLLWGSDKRN